MKAFHHKAGYTLVEMLIAVPVASLCMIVIFYVIWSGTRLVTRNISVNLAHVNVATPMQRLTDDVHLAMVMPQLTGTLAAGATGTVPQGYSGGTKSWTSGKMTNWSLPIVTGSGPAEGVQLYLMVSSSYAVNSTFGSYNTSKSGFMVANGSYSASATSISLELNDNTDKALLTSATNGMHLCIPSAGVLISGSNYAMVDKKITSVTFSGVPVSGTAASTLVATCNLSGTLGAAIQTNGTRNNSTTATTLAYLVAPVNYFVCGSDLIRLNYDGTWETVMRNVMPTNKAWTQAKPFSMPWPYATSFLSSSNDGRRAISIRLAASNPDYTTVVSATNDFSSQFRGYSADMVFYDIVIWSRTQLFDEVTR